jgi:hypothetical protein
LLLMQRWIKYGGTIANGTCVADVDTRWRMQLWMGCRQIRLFLVG